MRAFLMWFVLCMSSVVSASSFTVCDLAGDSAKQIITYKNRGVELQEIEAIFVTWYFRVTTVNGAVSPEDKETIIRWLKKIEGDSTFEVWFERVYNTYTDPRVAQETELESCQMQ